MSYRRPAGWIIYPYDHETYKFHMQRIQFSGSDTKRSLSIQISPFNGDNQRIAIASQVQSKYNSYNVKPTKEQFIQDLKETPNNDPNAIQTRLYWRPDGMSNKAFGIARHAHIIQSNLALTEVAELAQTMMFGVLTPNLQTILEDAKNNRMRGFEALSSGSLSGVESYVETSIYPFIDAITSEMIKGTPSSVQDVTNSALAILGSKEGSLDIESDLDISDVNFDKLKDILIVGTSTLYLAGSYINLRSKMASMAIQILLFHQCYNAEICSELLRSILVYESPDGERLGRVVVIENENTRTNSIATASLVARTIEQANLLAACQDAGVIGKIINTYKKGGMMDKSKSIRKEYAKCPQFVALAKSVGYSN